MDPYGLNMPDLGSGHLDIDPNILQHVSKIVAFNAFELE
jgi:hypothetical protein